MENKIIKNQIFEWSKTIIIAVIIALFITKVLVVNANVPTASMSTTIEPGDRLFANRLAYLNKAPERGDIIVFVSQEDEGKLYVKRLIGLPGEEITITAGKVYIDGTELVEGYLNAKLDTRDYGSFEVPEGHYFFLGDNRYYSYDARKWDKPYIPESDLVGKALVKYFPGIKMLDSVEY